MLTFTIPQNEEFIEIQEQPIRLIIAGWTGRDADKVQEHIEELAAIGVPKPSTVPVFYQVSASRLTQSENIQVVGNGESGEVEFVLANIGGDIYVGLGSDHTDRDAEVHGITLAKQMCDKPISHELWALNDVLAHWDHIELEARIRIHQEQHIYQKGSVADMLHPVDLLNKLAASRHGEPLQPGEWMMCGTLPAIGGIKPAHHFSMRLHDPVRNRSIFKEYSITNLDING